MSHWNKLWTKATSPQHNSVPTLQPKMFADWRMGVTCLFAVQRVLRDGHPDAVGEVHPANGAGPPARAARQRVQRPGEARRVEAVQGGRVRGGRRRRRLHHQRAAHRGRPRQLQAAEGRFRGATHCRRNGYYLSGNLQS